MLIGTDPNGVYRLVKTNEEGILKVSVEGGETTEVETTLNASVQTVGTTATSIAVNKKVTAIDIANYSEEANVTLIIGSTSYVIGSNIATTLTINKDVTNISLVSTTANTKVQIVIKGFGSNDEAEPFMFRVNRLSVDDAEDYEEATVYKDAEDISDANVNIEEFKEFLDTLQLNNPVNLKINQNEIIAGTEINNIILDGTIVLTSKGVSQEDENCTEYDCTFTQTGTGTTMGIKLFYTVLDNETFTQVKFMSPLIEGLLVGEIN